MGLAYMFSLYVHKGGLKPHSFISFRNECLNIKIYKCLSINMSNFQPLGVVGRGSETQLQVSEN